MHNCFKQDLVFSLFCLATPCNCLLQAGLVHIHVGPGASGLQALRKAAALCLLPAVFIEIWRPDRSLE